MRWAAENCLVQHLLLPVSSQAAAGMGRGGRGGYMQGLLLKLEAYFSIIQQRISYHCAASCYLHRNKEGPWQEGMYMQGGVYMYLRRPVAKVGSVVRDVASVSPGRHVNESGTSGKLQAKAMFRQFRQFLGMTSHNTYQPDCMTPCPCMQGIWHIIPVVIQPHCPISSSRDSQVTVRTSSQTNNGP